MEKSAFPSFPRAMRVHLKTSMCTHCDGIYVTLVIDDLPQKPM